MPNVIISGDRYTINDPLYQWDLNQTLEIRGLSLPSIPEIHFTNEAMGRAMVCQATMDEYGIVRVVIPNSILQDPNNVITYVCIYNGKEFETLYKFEIPLKPRKKPLDYVFVDNAEELYSYNALANKIDNTLVLVLARYDEVNANYQNLVNEYETKTAELTAERESLLTEYDTINTRYTEACNTLDSATSEFNQAKTNYEGVVSLIDECETVTAECEQIVADAKEGIASKENKATITAVTMLASGWSAGVYSFEADYPVATYNIEIALNSTATADQADAFNGAQMVGSITANEVKAFGDVPTIDIPIVIKAVVK